MRYRTRAAQLFLLLALSLPSSSRLWAEPSAGPAAVVWPLERTAYFSGESVPLAFSGVPAGGPVKLEALLTDKATLLYEGPATNLAIDTRRLMPGVYRLQLNGAPLNQIFSVTSPLRRSAGSLQDEATPSEPQLAPNLPAAERQAAQDAHWNQIAKTLRETGLTACLALGASDMGQAKSLDVMARTGVLLLVNPDTRPTSFFPLSGDPAEIDGMSQRMILTADANARYPNFGGFLLGWDTTGFPLGGRKSLMTYWGWGDKADALRKYIDRQDEITRRDFTARTGLAPVAESEYISYLLSIGYPEFAPAIDLPTKLWLEDIARHTKPMTDGQRVEFEKRLDAWSTYLMGLYRERYGELVERLRAVDPTLRHTASVQVDHQAVRNGQYFPWAYEPLDLQYQTTWNDQVGGPDYAYQWLLTAGLLDMQRQGKPTWLSNTLGTAHSRALFPGKFTRVAAHGLAWGVTGIGFALEGFSNILGGMNPETNWGNLHGKAGEADLLAGREFLDRFSALAVAGRGHYGVGVLYSRAQAERQNFVEGFGSTHYKAFVTLTRLGYTPRFVTEEDLSAGRCGDIAALVVFGQTFPLAPVPDKPVPDKTSPLAALEAFVARGGRILVDGSTTIALPKAEKLPLSVPFTLPGKPHNWVSPNMVGADNDTWMAARWHAELAPVLAAALGDTGRGILRAERGPETEVSLIEIDGGPDARYVVAVNDSHVSSQADWHQVREKLVPTGKPAPETTLYDCTDERRLGPLAAFECDLTATTARVFASLPRAVASIDLSARQKMAAGEDQVLAVRMLDAQGQALRAVVPFELTLRTPQNEDYGQFYRSTDRQGKFAIRVPIPANAPGGQWTATLRCQLDGRTVTLPFAVSPTAGAAAAAIEERVIVRNRPAIEQALVKGSKWVLPIFASPQADALRQAAEQFKTALAQRGVDVEIRPAAQLVDYYLAYDPSPEQLRENARVDAGQAIGRIRRETVNGNDWYSSLSGYRCGAPLIVLDLVPVQEKADVAPAAAASDGRPLAAALDAAGALWPKVSGDFPGPNRAVLEAVPWAFAPRQPATIVVQAVDAGGLSAAAQSLAKLPQDRFTPGIQQARRQLWQEHHVGGAPDVPDNLQGLSGEGLRSGTAPQPFAIRFGQDKPPKEAAPPPAAVRRPAIPLPATILPKQYALYYRDDEGRFFETATADMLVPDLRFSQALGFNLDNAQAGPIQLVAAGQFRYSDRAPRWQAQWEDILKLHAAVVPKSRQPMEIEIWSGGRQIGKLSPSKTEERDVPLEQAFDSAGLKPKTAHEEVVTRLTGTVELPAGKQEIYLVPRHIVDGQLQAVGVGEEPKLPSGGS